MCRGAWHVRRLCRAPHVHPRLHRQPRRRSAALPCAAALPPELVVLEPGGGPRAPAARFAWPRLPPGHGPASGSAAPASVCPGAASRSHMHVGCTRAGDSAGHAAATPVARTAEVRLPRMAAGSAIRSLPGAPPPCARPAAPCRLTCSLSSACCMSGLAVWGWPGSGAPSGVPEGDGDQPLAPPAPSGAPPAAPASAPRRAGRRAGARGLERGLERCTGRGRPGACAPGPASGLDRYSCFSARRSRRGAARALPAGARAAAAGPAAAPGRLAGAPAPSSCAAAAAAPRPRPAAGARVMNASSVDWATMRRCSARSRAWRLVTACGRPAVIGLG